MMPRETIALRLTTLPRRLESLARGFIQSLPRAYDLVIILAAVILYAIVWSWISILRFMALQAYVFDAGIFMQQWYDAYTVHWTMSSFFWSFSLVGISFVFGPLALLRNFPLLLTFQSVFIALGALPIYGAARILGLSKLTRTALAGSYLIFFPLAGVSWFDLHYEAFFPTLFMLGFFFLLRKNYAPSMAFFVLASITKYPLSLFVTAFAIGAIAEVLLTRNRSDYGWVQRKFLLVLGTVSFALFFVRYVAVLIYAHAAVPGDIQLLVPSPPVSTFDEMFTVVLLLGPFLFLPVRSIRWMLPIVMWLGLAVYSGFWGYNYPNFVNFQYAYELTPFLFMGTVEILSNRRSRTGPARRYVASTTFNWYRAHREPVSVISILACIIVLALFFQPYGPFNGAVSGTGFDMTQELSVNTTQFYEIQKVMTLIPTSDPYVVVQNDLPEFFPRDFGYTTIPPEATPGWLETPGVNHGGIPYNLTYQAPNGSWFPIRIDYIVADQNLQGFLESDPPPYNLTMAQLIKDEYSSGQYGILAELSGIILLEHGYSGPPKIFRPSNTNFTASALASNYHQGGLISITGVATGPDQWVILWRSPYITAFPGVYKVNLLVRGYAVDPLNDSIEVIVTPSGSTQIDSDYFYLNESNIPGNDSWGWIHLSFNNLNFTDDLLIVGQLNPSSGWKGNFDLSRVSFVPVAVPIG